MPEPTWDRLPKETDVAYQAFLTYRDLPPDERSIPAVQAKLAEGSRKGRGRVNGRLNDWSADHDWVERARAWDNYLRAERDKVAAREAAKWERRRQKERERDYQDARRLRGRFRELLSHPIDPSKWAQRDLATILKAASELAAFAINPAVADAGSRNEVVEAIRAALNQPDVVDGDTTR